MALNVQQIDITGTVKWFDNSKGYGFVEAGGEDALLHVSVLRSAGWQNALEGSTVRGVALRRQQGLQVARVDQIDETTSREWQRRAAREMVEPTSGWANATVKWFNPRQGFGFLTRGHGTPDIFVHKSLLRSCGIPELRHGQAVIVRWGEGEKGCVAGDLRLP